MSPSLCQLSNGDGPCPLEGVVQRPLQTLPVEVTNHVMCGATVCSPIDVEFALCVLQHSTLTHCSFCVL